MLRYISVVTGEINERGNRRPTGLAPNLELSDQNTCCDLANLTKMNNQFWSLLSAASRSILFNNKAEEEGLGRLSLCPPPFPLFFASLFTTETRSQGSYWEWSGCMALVERRSIEVDRVTQRLKGMKLSIPDYPRNALRPNSI